MELELGDDVGGGEGGVGGLLVADLPVEHHVVVLVDLVVPDERGVLGQALLRVDDHRQLLVLDHDRLAGILGDVRVVGDDGGDLLALEADLVRGEHRLGVVGQGRHPRQVAGGHRLTREHQSHTGHVPGCGGVDRLDAGVGDGGAEDLHVEHPREDHVVDVVALTDDEPVVLDAPAARAEAADLDLVERHQASSPASSRSFSPAHRTAFTMFW